MSNGHEKRQFGRRQTNYHAWIVVPGRPRLNCVVRNLSLGGALLELDKPSWLPFTFQLVIEATRFNSFCEVRHQSPTSVGVRFMTATEHAAMTSARPAPQTILDERDAWMGAKH